MSPELLDLCSMRSARTNSFINEGHRRIGTGYSKILSSSSKKKEFAELFQKNLQKEKKVRNMKNDVVVINSNKANANNLNRKEKHY